MSSKKKILTAILSVALVVAIAAGSTFAYLSAQAGEKTNVFTFSDNIRGTLGEPNWEPGHGEDLTPAMEIRKDPMITNTSDNGVSEYAAIKVAFQKGDGTALTDAETARLLGLVTIDWNTTDWALINGTTTSTEQTYVYTGILAPGEVTNALFNTVTINSEISDEDFAWLSGFAQNHTNECYTFGTHDDALCTITYKHHVNCAIYGQAGAEAVAKGGTLGANTCDCTPAEQHEADCPSLIGNLNGTCAHSAAGAINGFNIKNTGAVVQADQFASATDDATKTAINTLFGD